MRALIKGIGTGITVALLCLVIGAIPEGIIVPGSVQRSKSDRTPVLATASAGNKPDDFQVSTTDEIISSESISRDIRYLLPISVAIMIVTSAWAYRRSRSA